jgi:hypothetical protein
MKVFAFVILGVILQSVGTLRNSRMCVGEETLLGIALPRLNLPLH